LNFSIFTLNMTFSPKQAATARPSATGSCMGNPTWLPLYVVVFAPYAVVVRLCVVIVFPIYTVIVGAYCIRPKFATP